MTTADALRGDIAKLKLGCRQRPQQVAIGIAPAQFHQRRDQPVARGRPKEHLPGHEGDIARQPDVALGTGALARIRYAAQFHAQRAVPNTYFVINILDRASDTVVATGTLVIERKFLHGLGSVGHIEDVAVDRAQQGRKLGLCLTRALRDMSEALGCYKTMGACASHNIRAW